MSDLMTTADMADGKLDLTTLKVYINGDENVVNEPRLAPGVNVGSLAALNKHVKDKVDLQIATIPSGRKGYKTYAEAQAAQASLPTNTLVEVTNDTDTTKNGVYLWDGVTLAKSTYDPLTQAKEYARQVSNYQQIVEYSGVKNIGGKLAIDYAAGLFYVKIAVAENDKYFVPTQDYSVYKGWYITDASNNVLVEAEDFREASESIATAPANSAFLYINYPMSLKSSFKAQKLSDADIIALRASGIYPKQMGVAYLADTSTPPKASKVWSDPVVTYIIDVKQGEKYLVDAKAIGTVKSYYFVKDDMTIVASDNNEPTLKILTVPAGATKLIVCSDITYAVTIKKLDYFDEITLSSTAKKIKDYYPPQPSYRNLIKDKCQKFYQKLHDKSGDLCVVITGTSLTQGNLYATDRADATTRPPLLHTNDLASHVYDSLKHYWHGQQYRRYDHSDLIYSAGSWQVINRLQDASGNDVWDDFDYRKNGLTKTTIAPNASVSTKIPIGAWQFNFIYRTDSQGGNSTVSITQGNGQVEVWNGSAWVEANGFVLSMLEPATTPTKGNTCYQKRLKMRCKNRTANGFDSTVSDKTITITKANDTSRFNVVGFEWSPREYMFTFVNGARGSHAWGLSDSPSSLEKYQDNDVWEFNPDLILCEVTAINWGAAFGESLFIDKDRYVNIAKKAYFDDLGVQQNSLYDKSAGYTKCEVVFYGDIVGTLGDFDKLWDANKQPKFGAVTVPQWNGTGATEPVGTVKTVFENYEAVEKFVASKPYIFIPAVYQFKKLADDFYGNYVDAFAASGKGGQTLSYDGTHLNDNGAAFWAYLITPLFANL